MRAGLGVAPVHQHGLRHCFAHEWKRNGGSLDDPSVMGVALANCGALLRAVTRRVMVREAHERLSMRLGFGPGGGVRAKGEAGVGPSAGLLGGSWPTLERL